MECSHESHRAMAVEALCKTPSIGSFSGLLPPFWGENWPKKFVEVTSDAAVPLQVDVLSKLLALGESPRQTMLAAPPRSMFLIYAANSGSAGFLLNLWPLDDLELLL